MKIAFLEAVQTYGGARKSTVELAKNISSNNEVVIVDTWGCCVEFVNAVEKNNIKLKILNPRKSAITLEGTGILNKLLAIFYFIREHWRLKNLLIKELEAQKPDIVIVNNPKTLSLIKPSKKYKIVFFAREWMLPKQIKKRSKKLFLEKVDRFICVSEASRHALYAGGIAPLENIYVVPNSIIIDENLKRENSSRLTLIHCGGFLPTKGQLTIIEIAKRIKAIIPDFKIYMVGIIYTTIRSQRFLHSIQNSIRDENLGENIEIVIDAKDISEIYGRSKILLHPSFSEGLPRVIMEAMAHKVAVIANPVGGVNDFILNGYTGMLTMHNDVDDYISKIITLHTDFELYNGITERAFDLIKTRYTKELQVEKFENTLHKIFQK